MAMQSGTVEMMKSEGEIGSPCWTPLVTANCSDWCPFTMSWADLVPYSLSIVFLKPGPNPMCFSTFFKYGHCTRS